MRFQSILEMETLLSAIFRVLVVFDFTETSSCVFSKECIFSSVWNEKLLLSLTSAKQTEVRTAGRFKVHFHAVLKKVAFFPSRHSDV